MPEIVKGDVPHSGLVFQSREESNRAVLPMDCMDFAGYPLNPQVHAFDIVSIMETIEAQPATVETARTIIADKPLYVGPITLKPRSNPPATNPEDADRAEDPETQKDPGQLSLFAAGWHLGSIGSLSRTDVRGLTYFSDVGPLGVMDAIGDADGSPPDYPIYHVLHELSGMTGANMLLTELSHPRQVATLALRSGSEGHITLFIANLVNESINVALEGVPASCRRMLRLDEETVPSLHSVVEKLDLTGGLLANPVSIRPFGMAIIRF